MSAESFTPGQTRPELSSLPDGWRAVQLAEVASFCGGGRLGLTKERDYRSSGFPAFSAAGQDGFVERWEFDASAVVVPSIGSIGRAYAAHGKWTTLANTQIIFPDAAQLDYRFLHYRVDDTDYWPVSGTAQPFIKPSDIPKCWLALPPLNVQLEVVAALETVDRALRAAQSEVEKLRLVGVGLRRSLLLGHARLTAHPRVAR